MASLLTLILVIAIRAYRRPLTPYHHDWRRAFVHDRLVTLGLLYCCAATTLMLAAIVHTLITGRPQ